MKNIFLSVIIFCGVSLSAQLRNNATPSNGSITNNTAFLDASSSTLWNGSTNNGKGLVFPRTELAKLTTLVAPANGTTVSYPGRLDGMIVYNTSTSGSAGVGTTQGTLSPGFYYYENKTTDLNGGTWKPFTTTPVSPATNVVDNNETVTNLQFNGLPVYMRKGKFTSNGTNTAPSSYAYKVVLPSSSASVYRITIYKSGTANLYANSVYSFAANGDLITGSPSISVVYPSGDYDYVVEYLK